MFSAVLWPASPPHPMEWAVQSVSPLIPAHVFTAFTVSDTDRIYSRDSGQVWQEGMPWAEIQERSYLALPHLHLVVWLSAYSKYLSPSLHPPFSLSLCKGTELQKPEVCVNPLEPECLKTAALGLSWEECTFILHFILYTRCILSFISPEIIKDLFSESVCLLP